jgi:hypothetical protein
MKNKENFFLITGVIAIVLLLIFFMFRFHVFSGKLSATASDTTEHRVPYQEFLKEIQIKKKTITNSNEAKRFLFEIFDQKIPQYWTGTAWDFNGVSRQPNQGSIACGYFVTNTLTDAGFDIQRVKLAQSVSSEMINQLCVNIKRFSNFDELLKHIRVQSDNSIFIIGLDFHTGFMLKTENEIYFLHSNYINKQGVIKEAADKSLALKSSKSFMIGSLTDNVALIKKWMKN